MFDRSARFLALMVLAFVAICAVRAHPGARARDVSIARQRREHSRSAATVPMPAATPSPASDEALDEADVVRVDTDLANVLLTAIDKDKRFITTLRRDDIRVFENNVPQELSVFERETDLPLSLAILVDTSRSQEGVLPEEKAAGSAFVDAVMRLNKDHAAVISFTGEAHVVQALTDNMEKLRRAIDRVKVELPADNPDCSNDDAEIPATEDPRCWTSVWDAVGETVDKVLSKTPEQTRRAIILLSDGDDTRSRTQRQEAIDFAVKNNVVVYSIGIRDQDFPYGKLDTKALRKISEGTGGRAFFAETKAELLAAFAQIQEELRAQYLVAYSPTNKTRDGSFRRVRLEIVSPALRKQKLRLLYREGYYAKRN